MQPLTPDVDHAPKQEQRTLAELLIYLDTAELRREIEQFRIKYEAKFGETDLTKRYTSTLSPDEQEWLQANHPKRFWNGLPTFVQAFIKEKFHLARRNGKLDDMPVTLLSLYLNGKMSVGDDGPSL
jgi:hypothetical protein